MTEEKFPEWLNNFVNASFGQYEVMNPHDFVQKMNDEQQSLQQKNTFNYDSKDTIEKSNVEGINDQTGDRFEVVVKMEKNKDDKGMQVEFASGDFKDNYICSSIDDFCNGRYAHLSTQPLRVVAEEIAKDVNYINNYIETSIASNSDSITIETALDVTLKITKNSSISDSDYKKICSKLNYEDATVYNNYLKNAGVKILAPVSSVQYYVNYIKNFKEYLMASANPEAISDLQVRVASIEKFKSIASELSEEFKKDEILRNIKLGE